ncbi:hypothetical protein DPMN_101839 [Dreissena polymorpha]|uniref:Uncharacterized protein n=1 Tax=Dreissena polymorpha TaxID=45954 RepID=A0A9D4R8L8_DREPO|nr:hypothetical protein DPMN_101839 [Dreissena polymorpha]
MLTSFYYSHIWKNAPPPCTIFKLVKDIIGKNLLTKKNARPVEAITNVLTKFREDWTMNATFRVHPGGHIFQPTGIIFELVQDIIGNLLTKFHEDQIINVASRVLTRKTSLPLGSHVFQANTNLLTKFHEDWTINANVDAARRTTDKRRSQKLTMSKLYSGEPNCFSTHRNHFELFQDIIGTNLVTKFHEDWMINVASIVLTRKNVPPPVGHVFQPTRTIFELIQDIIGTNLLTKFHDGPTINVISRVLTMKNALPPGGNVFQPTVIIFKLFHEDQTINVASRVKNALAWRPCFSSNHTVARNLLAKFHEDWTINVASIVLTRQMLTLQNA